MRLAFYTYSYTDRQNLDVESCLRRIARTGYDGIDESATFGSSDSPQSVSVARRAEIRTSATRYELSLEALVTHAELTTSLAADTPLDLRGSVDLAADVGANVVTFHMGGRPESLDGVALRTKVVRWLHEAANYGAGKHIALAVDGIWPTWIVDSPDALDRLFAEVDHPNLGVNFDPCYLTLMGVDPVAFVRRFKDRIPHAHLKDHVGKYPKWEHRIPGGGQMDYVPIFAALKEAGFDGSAAVECFVSMPFEQACDEGYAAMRKAMRAAGVESAR